MSKLQEKAVSAINKKGVLLVFPIKHRRDVPSLWQEFYPRTPMKWEWNEDSDNRISKLWILMKELSVIRDVVYAKWYQGRATFFSRKLFTALLKVINESEEVFDAPPMAARDLMDTLEENSPLSTKELKVLTELTGKDNAAIYNRALNWLFARLQVVGFGEADDGAFPSLVVGATKLMYEDLWLESEAMDLNEAQAVIEQYLPRGEPFGRFLDKIIGPRPPIDIAHKPL